MLNQHKNFFFQNITTRQTLAKNVFWLSVSNVAGRLLRAIIIIYAARILGAAEWGIFSYALSIIALLTILADMGISGVVARETAREKSNLPPKEILSTAFYIKLALLTVGILLVVFFAPYLTNLPKVDKILPIVALVLAFDTMRDFGFAIARAFEKMEWEAGLFIITNLAVVSVGFVFLHLRPTIESFSIAYGIGTGIGTVTTFWVLRRKLAGLWTNFSRQLVRPLITAAWPMAISGILGGLMLNTDVIVLGWFRSAEEVGFYAAVQRIIQLFYTIPVILATAAFPIFSRLANREDTKLKTILEKTISFSLLWALPLTAGGIILRQPVIELIFGSGYLPAALPFGLLSLTFALNFPTIILTNAVFAYGAQAKLVIFSAIGSITNALFDLVLIPPWGITGSAVATILSQALALAYLYKTAQKYLPLKLMPHLTKITAATILMAAAVILLNYLAITHVILTIATAATFYFTVLYLLGEPTLKDIHQTLL